MRRPYGCFLLLVILSCSGRKNSDQFAQELKLLDLNRGDIALCSSGTRKFGTVSFGLACSETAKPDFELAVALLHSFEYPEAEKMFARVLDNDPSCVMAYWGAAMCNFHGLWEPPPPEALKKGERIVALGRSLVTDPSSRESDYLEAIATIYDHWDSIGYRARVLKYEAASEKIYKKYPEDDEAAIFYSLALRAASDPADKTFAKQKKAGAILAEVFRKEPNHPGIAHYIIHNYDYPELAELALPAARRYASIASESAHAKHMPSHIFTRMGYWDESIQSNLSSMSAAQCYAQNMKIDGHLDEEIHAMDYLVYAYLQKAEDKKAAGQVDYFRSFTHLAQLNAKNAYAFAAMPARYALERRNWSEAAALELMPADFPWKDFPWERSNVTFARLLGAVQLKHIADARKELAQLIENQRMLVEARDNYKANLVQIQVKLSEAWVKVLEGRKVEAVTLATDAALMEDATEKHPVTPGEIIPARELLADLYMELGEPAKALVEYEANLVKHPGRYNGLRGAARAARKSGNMPKAKQYEDLLIAMSSPGSRRPAPKL